MTEENGEEVTTNKKVVEQKGKADEGKRSNINKKKKRGKEPGRSYTAEEIVRDNPGGSTKSVHCA